MGDRLGNEVGSKSSIKTWLVVLKLKSFGSLGVNEKKKWNLKLTDGFRGAIIENLMNEGWLEPLELCR